jgi:hypothetical protein
MKPQPPVTRTFKPCTNTPSKPEPKHTETICAASLGRLFAVAAASSPQQTRNSDAASPTHTRALRHHIPKPKISSILLYVKNKSTVVNIDAEIAEKAAEINFQHKKTFKGWGMLDSIVYAVTVLKKGRVITGDPHFKNLPQVTYIGT